MALAAPTIMPGGVIHRGTDPESRIMPSIDPEVALYDADIYPLTHITRQIRNEVVYDIEHKWFDNQYVPRWDTIDEAGTYTPAAAGSTSTLHVDHAYYPMYSLLHLPHIGAYLRVETIDATGLILTVRTVSQGSGAAADGAPIVRLGTAYPTGTTAGEPVVTQIEPRLNYTVICRWSVEQDNTMAQVKKWTGDDLALERMKALKIVKMDMEWNTIAGKKSKMLINGKWVTTTDGILNVDNLNTENVGGVLTESNLRQIMKRAFRWAGTNRLLAISGVNFINTIDGWGAEKLQTRPGDETYGVTINRYKTFHGELNIVNHYLLEGSYYSGVCILVDLSKLTYRPLGNRDLRLYPDIKKENNYDGRKDEFLVEFMITCKEGASHTKIYGIA